MLFSIHVHFTRSQLMNFHRQFFHKSASKIFNLKKKARTENTAYETLLILQEILKRCDPCQFMKLVPFRFRVTVGSEHLRLNGRVLIDIMYISTDSTFLHIVYNGTNDCAACFLKSTSTDAMWEAFIRCWTLI